MVRRGGSMLGGIELGAGRPTPQESGPRAGERKQNPALFFCEISRIDPSRAAIYRQVAADLHRTPLVEQPKPYWSSDTSRCPWSQFNGWGCQKLSWGGGVKGRKG